MGVFFCYALLNRAPCHVISKLGNSLSALRHVGEPFGCELRAERLMSSRSRSKGNLAVESYDPSILPNFEMTTNLKLYLRA